MRVIVKGETIEDGLLPSRNYLLINNQKYPLGHCFTLLLPLGQCQLEVCTPPSNTNHRASLVVKENYLYVLTLTVDASRDIVGAEVGYESITEDPWGLYANDYKKAFENLDKIKQWRNSLAPKPSAPSAPSTSYEERKGGKFIGWGIALMILFSIGVIGCLTGEIEYDATPITDSFELTNLHVYLGVAVIGLILFIVGLIRRNSRD